MTVSSNKSTNHPLDKFSFCPNCGSKCWSVNNFKSKHCEACGFTYYANPSSATAAFIMNDRNELLAVRRKKEPAKGTLDLPGGFVDMDESAEEGIVREVLEETGLRVTHVQYLFSIPNIYHYSGMDIHTLDMFYRCNVESTGSVQAMDDAEEALWIPLAAVCPDDFGLLSIRQAVRRMKVEVSDIVRAMKVER